MTREPLTVAQDLSITDGLDRMSANNVRHLLVVRDDRLVGVISNRDLNFAASLPGVDPDKVEITAAMHGRVYVCDEEAPLEDVAHDMEAHRYGCAVVLKDGFVVGIFTTTDAMRVLRTLVTGKDVEPAVHPTHRVDQPATRETVEHHVRVGDSLRRAHARPSPNQGKPF